MKGLKLMVCKLFSERIIYSIEMHMNGEYFDATLNETIAYDSVERRKNFLGCDFFSLLLSAGMELFTHFFSKYAILF